MVERINLRAQRRRHRLLRRAGAYHYGERRKAEMTVRNLDRRPRFPLKTQATHIAHHTDDCAAPVIIATGLLAASSFGMGCRWPIRRLEEAENRRSL